ncbi:hypothetical protein L1887_34831 [Cichorium endivia]|nr:hypothetical protein L1887_34831 [Cichorium endivia]
MVPRPLPPAVSLPTKTLTETTLSRSLPSKNDRQLRSSTSRKLICIHFRFDLRKRFSDRSIGFAYLKLLHTIGF